MPDPLTLEQLQQQVLDDDTVLLQYAIGEEQSYLFIVPHQGELIVHTIPHSRTEIQTAANNFNYKIQGVSCHYETEEDCAPYLSWLTRTDGEAQTLTQMILPPEIAQHLAGKNDC
ncbi:MAG: hypothetical protein IGR76_18705 [Synechococcales cyanobacterium T60_A2020_003]|nr:hypothetical protein [Synechococcales cyanobacterium T60_A2020_003]